jgi:beta-glucanase (GH16 family)
MSGGTQKQVTRRIPVGPVLTVSGWVALAATALSAADPARVVLVTVFLLVCPGAAAVRLAARASGRRVRPLEALETCVLVLALSLSLDTLVAEAYYLGHGFSDGRLLGTLAALTTLMALGAGFRSGRWRHSGAVEDDPAPVRPGRGPGGSPRLDRRTARLAAAAVLVMTAVACGGSGSAVLVRANASASPAPGAPGPWHEVFEDDFDGSALNRAAWTTCYDWNLAGCTNAGNREIEWYLPGQVALGDGRLSLTAARRPTVGSDGKSYPWTSGMVSTGRDSWNGTPHRTFTYGYFAAAVKVPPESGMLPAFWMMPDTRYTPPELDIAEFIGGTKSVVMTVHWSDPSGHDVHLGKRYGAADFSGGYHVFALDWEKDSLTWYVDGVARFRTTGHVQDTPMELLLDLAVGYPAAPPASVDSAVMKVDWVRVWQH